MLSPKNITVDLVADRREPETGQLAEPRGTIFFHRNLA